MNRKAICCGFVLALAISCAMLGGAGAVTRNLDGHDSHDPGASSKLMKLRPVPFRDDNDPSGTLRYRLTAEDVERLYPELVTRGPDGKEESVRYSRLIPLLLKEVQTQAARESAQARKIRQQEQQIEKLSAQLQHQKADFEQRLSAVERVLEATDLASEWAR